MTLDPRDPLPLLAMGSRWALDVSSLPEAEATAMRHRWSRCAELADQDVSVVIDDEVVPVVAVAGSPPAEPGEPAESTEGVRVPWSDPAMLPYDLSRALTNRGINRLKGQALMLHAASLTDETGRAVVLVASSGTGKSTAASRLGRHLGYGTDESVVITWDRDGEMILAPYPKPPSIILDPADPSRKEERSPEDLELGPTHPRPALGGLLALRRSDEHDPPSIAPVPLVEHLLDVITQTSSIFDLPDGLDHLAQAVTVAGAPVELRYREIEGCVDLVRDLLTHGTGAPVPTWRHHPPPLASPRPAGPPSSPSPPPAATSLLEDGAHLMRSPWSDAIEDESSLLVLIHSQPFELQGVGHAVWLILEEPRPLRELTDLVVAEIGDHADASDLVASAVGSMMAAGVLTVSSTEHPQENHG